MAGCVPTNYFHGETSVDIAPVLIWLKELETGEAQRRMGRWNKEPSCLCDQSNIVAALQRHVLSLLSVLQENFMGKCKEH